MVQRMAKLLAVPHVHAGFYRRPSLLYKVEIGRAGQSGEQMIGAATVRGAIHLLPSSSDRLSEPNQSNSFDGWRRVLRPETYLRTSCFPAVRSIDVAQHDLRSFGRECHSTCSSDAARSPRYQRDLAL